MELSRFSGEAPDPEPSVDLYLTLIASGVGIPKRMLIGNETGERASSEDQKTYLGMVAGRQKNHAEPNILRQFIDRLVQFGGLSKPSAKGYEAVWPALHEESESDIATANLARAQTDKALTPVGGTRPRSLRSTMSGTSG